MLTPIYITRKPEEEALFQKTLDVIKRLRVNPVFTYVMLVLLGAVVGIVSLLLGAAVFGVPMFKSYFDTPLVILLNLLPPALLIIIVFFISGRAWIAFSVPSLLTLLLSLIHFFKIQVRGDPFYLSDFAFTREAGSLLSTYSLTMNWKVYLAILVFVGGTVFSVFLLKHKPKRAMFRVIASVAAAAVFATLYLSVYMNAELYDNTYGSDIEGAVRSSAKSYIIRGFVYPFMHTMKESMESLRGDDPDWYNAQDSRRLLEAYESFDIPDDKKVNLIGIMLESYVDISRFGVLDFNIDVYEPFHALQREAVSGMLAVNSFAGGTIDAERLFLTGNMQLTVFNKAPGSFIYYLKNQGYYAEGMHTGDRWFYDRRPVNKLLGFDNYYFLEDFENSRRDDEYFFETVLNMYRSRDTGTPYFNFSLSYQNHAPYDSYATKEPHIISQGGISDESFNILNNYLLGIYDTTLRVEGFIDSFRADPEPVVIVVFGDHMPWLGNNNTVYTELGINLDSGTDDGFYNCYYTPYFIWANDAAKDLLGNDFTGDGGSFSPGFLMGEIFSLCSWEGDGYMRALRELQASIDVFNYTAGRIRADGVLTPELPEELIGIHNEVRGMEIYRRDNFTGY